MHNMKKLILSVFIFTFGFATATKCPASEYAPYETASGSHKQYDSVTIEYADGSGAFHGAIFRLAKGQGQPFKDNLNAHGAHITPSEDSSPAQSASEDSPQAAQQWSVQVDRVDSGDATLDPSFSDAVYENLLHDLAKAKQFEYVFRSGDRNANHVAGLLVLKTLVKNYSPGSETRRAVTTVAGAAKLKVQIQVLTRNGQVCLEAAGKESASSL